MARSDSSQSRVSESKSVRIAAADMAAQRGAPKHVANGEEQRYASARYAMSFTKGLEHEKETGLVERAEDFEAFRAAIDEGCIDPFTSSVRPSNEKQRAWEAPTAGVVFDLQGPDAQAVTMAPAPELGGDELAYEMAEVYELAALRDVRFDEFEAAVPNAVQAAADRLNQLSYTTRGFPGRPRKTNNNGLLHAQTAFRGSSPRVEVGPYLSQFMLIGSSVPGTETICDGMIKYGAQRIDQRVPVAKQGRDFMRTAADWLAVQNGANPDLALGPSAAEDRIFGNPVTYRFITTPRDLATYVHFDALYQAYLNACLVLLSMRTPRDPAAAPFDPAFARLSGEGVFTVPGFAATESACRPDAIRTGRIPRAAGGFALYGGPHILSLVTEVATRALKAVRFQKFNNHIRLRPEALAGRLHFADAINDQYPCVGHEFQCLAQTIEPSITAAREASNANSPDGDAVDGKNKLLPMAFTEGSPMHPAYGAGHATVAGACITILKAFFDTDAILVREHRPNDDAEGKPCGAGIAFRRIDTTTKRPLYPTSTDCDHVTYTPVAFRPNSEGSKLEVSDQSWADCLTLEGELNKLAANISIGRNMAGVHYFSDYFDSVRMGEEIAIGILEEQALCYPTDRFVLSVPTFDGDVRRIGAR